MSMMKRLWEEENADFIDGPDEPVEVEETHDCGSAFCQECRTGDYGEMAVVGDEEVDE